MPSPTPQNVRFNDSHGIDFDVAVDGVIRHATITIEAVQALYSANPDLLEAVRRSSHITRLVAHFTRAGQDPVCLTTTMLDDKGLAR